MSRRPKKSWSRFCLTAAEQLDFDAAVFSTLYEQWAVWERKVKRAKRAGKPLPEPPCLVPRSFRKHLPARCTNLNQNTRETTAALSRLRGRGLVSVAPNARGADGPAYCLVPKRGGGGGSRN
jgi:hypothetical protein